MPTATTPKNVRISGHLSTLRKITASGSERPMTDIMKASTVPSAAPLPSKACTTGMIPAALEYIGTPIITATGTDHHAPLPITEAINPSGT